MKAVLIGGPRDGLELEVENRLRTLKIPVPDGLNESGFPVWKTIVYDRAPLLLAGVPIADVFLHRGDRPTRAQAVQAITRLFLAGAFNIEYTR